MVSSFWKTEQWIHEKDPDLQVYLRADREVSYHRAVEVMDLVRSAGINKLALETQWEEK
jgi:biopolymer transport protein ExbD